MGDCFVNQPAAFYAPLSASRHELAGPRVEWHREYSAVADSVLPLREAVAHFGRLNWQKPPCYGELQVRIYVSDRSTQAVLDRATSIGVATASRFFSATAAVEDTLGWKRARISWNAGYGDYGDQASMDYYVRAYRGRTIVLLFMYARHSSSRPVEDASRILGSWR
jgi:hypothetical protein